MSSSDPQPPAETGGTVPPGSRPPSTQEIPVVQATTGATATHQLPPHPRATTPTPVQAVDGPVPTGPVDFVPGLPGVGTPPPPPPVAPTPTTAPHPATTPVHAGAVQAAAAEAAPAQAAPAPTPSWPDTLDSDAPAGGHAAKPRARRPRDRAALLGLGLAGLSLVLLELGLALDFGGESYWSAVPLWSGFATACVLLALATFAASYPAGDRLRSGPAWRVAAGGLVGVAVFWVLVVLPVVDTDRGFVLTAALAALGGALWVGPRRKD